MVCLMKEDMAVALLSERLALACCYNSSMAKLVKWAARFHDVGKTEVPQAILNKPGKLLDCEFQIMKQHTKHGERLLSSVQGERGAVAVEVALKHHEWHNGQGYWGYEGMEIPMFVGIVSVCDVYVALCSRRSYKKAWPPYKALQYIKNRAGTQFCPKVVRNFVSVVGDNDRQTLNANIFSEYAEIR